MEVENGMSSVSDLMLGAGAVSVFYGANSAEAKVAGLTVEQVRRVYSVVIHVPREAAAMVNGQVVSGDFILASGDRLEFFKAAGQHG